MWNKLKGKQRQDKAMMSVECLMLNSSFKLARLWRDSNLPAFGGTYNSKFLSSAEHW
jgi:hypothetical protein